MICALLILMGTSVIAQKKLSATDSIILKFLITNGQFWDHAPEDTTHLAKELNSVLKEKIAVKGNISIIGFAANISHSQSYVLLKGVTWFTIIGDDRMENNILNLQKQLDRYKIRLTDKERLACYDLFIHNVMDRPEGPQLMHDDGIIK